MKTAMGKKSGEARAVDAKTAAMIDTLFIFCINSVKDIKWNGCWEIREDRAKRWDDKFV